MYYVYIIKSLEKNWHYVGFTKSVENRILEHNSSKVKSTKFYKPFILKFVQTAENRLEARDLERFLKVRFNKESLLRIL